ncbi:L,D-transpeptidase family protein [Rudanella lutea]|uniref:L,D-transpeptidase family protein n=1 Tax=Rudanella lutea TaxID=451374 RepID=UPI00036523FE|nr:L,D-transpeptidase family protein [Rudanella lutea]
MTTRWLLLVSLFLPLRGMSQSADDWARLRGYGESIGVEPVCKTPIPDRACLTTYLSEVIWGKPSRRLGYQGVTPQMDSLRLGQLVDRVIAGGNWPPLLDSLESHDPHYRQLKDYCWRCLLDDYVGDSLTIEQIKASLNTYRWLNRFPADKRVIVNLPSATLRVVDRQGETKLNSRVIVGKRNTPTPVFTARITDLVTYPYWNVPRSITEKELIPKIKRNPAILDDMNMQVIDSQGQVVDPTSINWTALTPKTFPYRLRQSTGCDNALGLMKFNLGSPYDIYLHDTNARHLFKNENRWLSHGCVRVEKPVELANELLGSNRFTPAYLNSCLKAKTPQTIRLPRPVPVFIIYNILDIDEAGAVRVYRDVYR